MCRDVTDGGSEARFVDANPDFIGSHFWESQNTLVADVGGVGNLFPCSVFPCLQRMSFHSFSIRADGLLDEQTVECNGAFMEITMSSADWM